MHAGYCTAISSRFSPMAGFANIVQSFFLQLGANFLNQLVTCIYRVISPT